MWCVLSYTFGANLQMDPSGVETLKNSPEERQTTVAFDPGTSFDAVLLAWVTYPDEKKNIFKKNNVKNV